MAKCKWLTVLVICVVTGLCVADVMARSHSARGSGAFVNSVGMKFVRIRSGSFLMGQQQGGDWDERPAHRVRITKSFGVALTEVTNAQYEQFDPKHREFRGKLGFSRGDDEAVVFVSWHEAVEFCRWLSEKEGRPYRLPTEAEWEYACRAGTTTAYHTGDSLPKEFHKNARTSWFPDPVRSRKGAEPVSLAVAQSAANPWGLNDMHGNVEEWCHDWYGPYEQTAQMDPTGRAGGDFKVTRGGSQGTQIAFLRSANRQGTLPEDKSWLIGFRVALGEMPNSEPLGEPAPALNRRNVTAGTRSDLAKGPDPEKPYFRGPRQYVKIPPDSDGPMYSDHNHDPALIDCPNGDLLAIWYSCRNEPGRELGILASRLRYGSQEWEPASPFWDTPDRNDHAPALWLDQYGKIHHFNGLAAAATWGSLATIMRVSSDSGATWSKAVLINPEHGIRHMPVESVFQTKEGFIVLPCDAVTGGNGGTAIHVSRDHGKTWDDPGAGRPNPTFASGTTGGWIAGIHAGVAQLRDGSLMAFGRGNSIDGRMPMSISEDMGKNWTYSPSEFPPLGSGQRLILRRLKEGPILFVSFTHRRNGMVIRYDGGTQRKIFGMFAALSFDEGKSWPAIRPITPGGAAREMNGGGNTGKFVMDETHAEPKGYLAATQTPDGLIHLISSKQHYVFNLAWIKQFAPTAPAGSVVITPQEQLVNILRVECKEAEKAAIVQISEDGKSISFDPEKGFIDFFGGSNKFTIRHDPVTKRYWSLVNKQSDPKAYRNNLVLVSSFDLRTWKVESVVLRHHDSEKHAFQYIDWLFENEDIIAVSRTAFDDGTGGAHNAHDANYITFHRIRSFRELRGHQ